MQQKLNLPVFDCRGSIICIFSSQQSKVIVKYGHNPIHRTVASRNERLKMKRQAEVDLICHKQPSLLQQQPTTSNIPTMDSNYLRPSEPVSETFTDSAPIDTSQPASYPSPSSSGNHSPTTETIVPQQTSQYFPIHGYLHDRAVFLLNERNIDVQSLSPEQMSVFENQSPVLQEQSLQMFALYGPSQLAIQVHTTADPVQLQRSPDSEVFRSRSASSSTTGPSPQQDYPSYPEPMQYHSSSLVSELHPPNSLATLTSTDPHVTNNGTPNIPGVFEYPVDSSASPKADAAQLPKKTTSKSACFECRVRKMKVSQFASRYSLGIYQTLSVQPRAATMRQLQKGPQEMRVRQREE